MLKLKNITVSFMGENIVNAVKDFNLNIDNGDKIAIIGETGSGKSILLLSILNLLSKNAKVSGEAIFEGKNLFDISDEELREIRGTKISYIPQGNGLSFNPLYTVGEQVGESLIYHKKYDKKTAFKKVIDLFRIFNLGNEEKLFYQYPHTYSGGMRQRALISMGIISGSNILLADEPTKGLDKKRIKMVEESFSLLKDKTIICVTHDIEFAENISEYICVMYSSSQFEIGKTQEIIKYPLHPYTKDIIQAMPENGLKFVEGFSMVNNQEENACKYYSRCKSCFEKCKKEPPFFLIGNRKVRCWLYEKY